ERGAPARRERVRELAHVEVERVREGGGEQAAGGVVDLEALRERAEPGLARVVTARLRDRLRELLGRLAVRTARAQRATGDARECRLVAQVDLRRRAR